MYSNHDRVRVEIFSAFNSALKFVLICIDYGLMKRKA